MCEKPYPSRSEKISTILSAIQQKLAGGNFPFSTALNEANAPALGILSARLDLQFSQSSDAIRLQQDLVSDFFRAFQSIYLVRGLFFSTNLSEPLLAEAAARSMAMTRIGDPSEPFLNVWGILAKYIAADLADKDDVLALIGRTISILAMDRGIHTIPKADRSELKSQTPIHVNLYYRTLLSDSDWGKLRSSLPSNSDQLADEAASTSFEEAFKDAYLHFSHYTRLEDLNLSSQEVALWQLWLRGAAIQLDNYEGSCISRRALPIFFSQLEKVGPDAVSWAMEVDIYGESRQACVGKCDLPTLPYLVLTNCFQRGCSNTHAHAKNLPVPFREGKGDVPRYELVLTGLESYRVIEEKHLLIIADMVKSALPPSRSVVITK